MELITQHQAQFEQLYELFTEWNGKINLSAIREKGDVFEKHFQDSLLPTDLLDLNNQRILDIGTGGGFPLLPLAITHPSSQFIGLDSVGKKLAAVQAMADELKLNVKTVHGRIEEKGRDAAFREKFDIVTARALAPWPVLLEYALPFVKTGGYFLAYQGPAIIEDLKNYKHLEIKIGGKFERLETKLLGANERHFVIIKKNQSTPRTFPRANGIPRQVPLR